MSTSADPPKRQATGSTSRRPGPRTASRSIAATHWSGSRHSSGNAAFDDYRAEQLRRLDEERSRLDEEIKAFHEYLANLNKAKDREEFDRFMRDRNSQPGQGFSQNN